MGGDKSFSVSNILGKGPGEPKLEEVYSVSKQLGKGAFGIVRLAGRKDNGAQVRNTSGAHAAQLQRVKELKQREGHHHHVPLSSPCWQFAPLS